MYYLGLYEDSYLACISTTPMVDAPEIESIEGLDLSGARMNAYRWDGASLQLDESRLHELQEEETKRDNAEIIDELKQKLSATDYAVIKIAEGSATAEEYADVIAQRKQWRLEINELEGDVI